jgi:polynucleotide 5'-kinase involved in rRNA processing
LGGSNICIRIYIYANGSEAGPIAVAALGNRNNERTKEKKSNRNDNISSSTQQRKGRKEIKKEREQNKSGKINRSKSRRFPFELLSVVQAYMRKRHMATKTFFAGFS